MRPKLRVGVLLDSLKTPAWAYLMLEKIQSGDDGELVLAAVKDPSQPEMTDGDCRPRKRLAIETSRTLRRTNFGVQKGRSSGGNKRLPFLYRLYKKVEDRLSQPHPDAQALRDVETIFKDAQIVHLSPRVSSGSVWYPPEDIVQIEASNLDVFLYPGSDQLCGAILHSTRLGVWQIQSGEHQNEDFNLPGFWEVFTNQPVTRLALVQAGEGGLPVKTLYRSYSATDPLSVNRNINRAYWKGASFAARKMRQIRLYGEEAEKFEQSAGQEWDFELTNKFFARLLGGYLWRYAANRLVKICFHTQWHLLFRFAGAAQPANAQIPAGNFHFGQDLAEYADLTPPREVFWSDPFVVNHQERHFIFFEEFIYRKKKAHISVLELDSHGAVEKPQVVLERPYHLSYPFVFEWEGTFYMIPETAGNRTIEVYRCLEFPGRWEFWMTLMENVVAMDTTLFYHQDRWWMFVNLKENEGASSWDELFLFWADQPLTNAWHAHPRNPVVSDVRKSRPAGRVFCQDGALMRPSQDSSQGYGSALNLNRILVLNESEYQEETVASLSSGRTAVSAVCIRSTRQMA